MTGSGDMSQRKVMEFYVFVFSRTDVREFQIEFEINHRGGETKAMKK